MSSGDEEGHSYNYSKTFSLGGERSEEGPFGTKIFDESGHLKGHITRDGMYTTEYYPSGKVRSEKGPTGTKIFDESGHLKEELASD